jgi:non-ribosomal peptide synthetase component F
LAAFENQEYQLEDLVDELKIPRDASRNPLFDIMFVLQNMSAGDIEIPGLKSKPYHHDSGISKFDLVLNYEDLNHNIYFTAFYCTRLFKRETVERFMAYFKTLMSSIGDQAGKTISGIEIISGEEKKRVLEDFNNTAVNDPLEKTIHELFRQQVEKNPGKTAVLFEGKYLTYGELNRRADRLAVLLREKGLRPGSMAATMVYRSLEMMVGILGVLKAGGAYIPVDPGVPKKLINFILKDSEVKLLLKKGKKAYRIAFNGEVVDLSAEGFHPGTGNPGTVNVNRPGDPAYIIYNPGSVGIPAATVMEHRGVVNDLCNLERCYPLAENGAYFLKSNCMQDISVIELFGWITGGGKGVILKSGSEGDLEDFVDIIHRYHVTHVTFMPLMLGQFLDIVKEKRKEEYLKELKYIYW